MEKQKFLPLPRTFYLRDAVTVARELLGQYLVRETPEGILAAKIIETEAYLGKKDAAAHSYKSSPFGRTNVQYGPGGYAYIYLIYGMHYCLNVVANIEDVPESVLIRALEPVAGIEQMKQLRKTEKELALCSGPGKLCGAMQITKEDYGADLCIPPLYIARGESLDETQVVATPRINIDYAGEAALYPYRFIVKDSPYLSVRLKKENGGKNPQKKGQTKAFEK